MARLENQNLELYCRRLITGPLVNHPYFTRSIRENGTVDVEDFQRRYKNLLGSIPTRAILQTKNVYRLTEKQKKVLLSAASGRTEDEIRQDSGIVHYRPALDRAYHNLRLRNVSGQMDMLYLREFESSIERGSTPKGFDLKYISEVRERLEQDALSAERSIKSLGFPRSLTLRLERAGINTIDELRAKTAEELIGIRSPAGYPVYIGKTMLGLIQGKVQLASTSSDTANIKNLRLPTQIEYALRRSGVETIDDLKIKTDEELLQIRHLGPVRVAKIRETLEAYQKQRKKPMNNVY
ncbi:MAG: hypothetical protein HY051_01490 [Candidatus Aenigmarchaeota archaeon]|nr:hypothetical protein [Candidatus Aenigmarchaeota archaeon]